MDAANNCIAAMPAKRQINSTLGPDPDLACRQAGSYRDYRDLLYFSKASRKNKLSRRGSSKVVLRTFGAPQRAGGTLFRHVGNAFTLCATLRNNPKENFLPNDKFCFAIIYQFAVMQELINYLLQFGQLNQQPIDLVENKGIFKEIKKDEYFQEAGKIPREVGFLTEGIIRICYYNNKGDEITKYFIDENNLIVDINSYNQNIPSSGYIQAITDCKFIVFSKKR
jgi:hypothetical protein